ncbi:unnamed protein product [Peniophora sp. CBMAI 1063]|nr:unnamed protein product [Peniophora sp. CBMAI 1063]
MEPFDDGLDDNEQDEAPVFSSHSPKSEGAHSPFAPDDADSWAVISDIALRHIHRVSTTAMHPQDAECAKLTWPPNLPRFEAPVPGVLASTRRVTLVNEDAHIPPDFRHPPTAPYILQAIVELYPALAKRPSHTYLRFSRTWSCPLAECAYLEDLACLSHAAGEAVCRVVATTSKPPFHVDDDCVSSFVRIVSGRYRARRDFIEDVVDIIGLRHFESHLSDVGLRCIIRGHAPGGQISFIWENVDLSSVLQSNTVDGLRARQHEERARLSMQKSLCLQARRWAHEARFREFGELEMQQRSARWAQHDFVRTLALDNILAGPGESFSGVRVLTPAQSSAVVEAGRLLHNEVYASLSARELEHQATALRLELAEEVIQDWERGNGWLRIQDHDA